MGRALACPIIGGHLKRPAVVSFYDPTTGGFLSRDPLNAMTRSAYGYVGGNPLNATDPSGLIGIPDWVPVVGGICVVGSDGCGATKSFAEDHPEVSQRVANVSGGILDGLSLGNARNVGPIRDRVRWDDASTEAGRWIGWGLTLPIAVGAPQVYGTADMVNAVGHTLYNCRAANDVESCTDCLWKSRSHGISAIFGAWAALGGSGVGGGAAWVANAPGVQDRLPQ